jgi:hypothetical protein
MALCASEIQPEQARNRDLKPAFRLDEHSSSTPFARKGLAQIDPLLLKETGTRSFTILLVRVDTYQPAYLVSSTVSKLLPGNLTDTRTHRNSQPLASRVVTRCHLKGIDQAAMEDYLRHHLKIAGVEPMLFDETAVTAIQQGSGGLFRKANHLARGALIAAAKAQSNGPGRTCSLGKYGNLLRQNRSTNEYL